MRLRVCRTLVVALLGAAACGTGERERREAEARVDMTPTVVLETTRGRIVIELNPDKAPITIENFLYHVRGGFYDGLIFHRVVPNFVIQAGELTVQLSVRRSVAQPITNEAANGLRNVRGAVGMARTAGDPHSAVAQFFINLKNNGILDFWEETPEGWGYAVFGHVVEGMDVVDSIAAGPTRRRGRHEALPERPVVIRRAYVAPQPASPQ